MCLIVPFCDFFDNYIFLTKISNFGTVRDTMSFEGRRISPDTTEIKKVHRACKPLFELMKKIENSDLKSKINSSLVDLNRVITNIREEFEKGRGNAIDTEEARALVADLTRHIDVVVEAGNASHLDQKILQGIKEYTGGKLEEYITNSPITL